jgi:hypothetical protein
MSTKAESCTAEFGEASEVCCLFHLRIFLAHTQRIHLNQVAKAELEAHDEIDMIEET